MYRDRYRYRYICKQHGFKESIIFRFHTLTCTISTTITVMIELLYQTWDKNQAEAVHFEEISLVFKVDSLNTLKLIWAGYLVQQQNTPKGKSQSQVKGSF